MVHLAELLVVMTDRFKIVRIHALNVHHIHRHRCLNDDKSRIPLLLPESCHDSMHGSMTWRSGGCWTTPSSRQQLCNA